jgi:protein TonB
MRIFKFLILFAFVSFLMFQQGTAQEKEVVEKADSAPSVQEVDSVSALSPMQLEGEVANRQILNRVKPIYSKRAKQQGWEGTVVLSFLVDANGNVFNIQVVRSSGYADLDNAAIQALEQWKFAPKPGKPEEKGRLTVYFNIRR